MNFKGQYRLLVDTKNRFFLPAKIRQGKKSLVIASGFDGCLYLYPIEVWDKLLDKFEAVPLKNKSEGRAFKRAFMASAKEVQIDSMGRILLPQELKDESKISKKIVVVGVGERLEIWPEDKWIEYYAKAKKVFSKLANTLEI